MAKYAIEYRTRLPVEIEIASEFRYRDPVLDRNTLVIAISQSGETADTLGAVRYARRQQARGADRLQHRGRRSPGESDAVLYTRAGPEVCVAATKTFATQLAAMYLVGLYLAQVRGTLFTDEVARVVRELEQVLGKVELCLERADLVRKVAETYKDAHDWLFLGRHVGYPMALEGALKLKEISYLHAEGYPAAELKHGPIALIEDGTPVVVVHPSSHVYAKMLTNIQEVAARGAAVIAIATDGDREVAAHATQLRVPATPQLLAPLVCLIPLQLLSYYVAVARGAPSTSPATWPRASRWSRAMAYDIDPDQATSIVAIFLFIDAAFVGFPLLSVLVNGTGLPVIGLLLVIGLIAAGVGLLQAAGGAGTWPSAWSASRPCSPCSGPTCSGC